MIKKNYHTHTYRCGHASGEDEEYVLAAIQSGIEVLGFSDHAAYRLPDARYRMNYEKVEDYISSIRHLKEKYKDQITIYLGMEVEYYPSEWDTLTYYRNELDYLILGQHRLSIEGLWSHAFQTKEDLQNYVELIRQACKRGLCDYICHPDLCFYSYHGIDDVAIEIAEQLAQISLEYQMPLELNCGAGVLHEKQLFSDGLRHRYPIRQVFEVFEKHQCPIIIGLDAHTPERLVTEEYLNRSLEIVEGLNLNYVGDDYDLIAEAKKRKKIFY